jgi:isoleucyl-tRNA synthetase
LVGRYFRSPFQELPAQEGVTHQVIPWDEVSDAEGTGIVHIAPGAGAEDFALSKEYDLAVIAPLAEDGTYLDNGQFGPFTGLFAGDVPQMVFDSLKERASCTASRTTRTATRPAGAAAPSSSSDWSTNGSSTWTARSPAPT